jgi:hypothetical protein
MRFLFFIFIFFFTKVNAQKSYPYLYTDSLGDNYIVLTMEQAQKLDNATEFSPVLFKENATYYKLVDSIYNEKIKFAVQEITDIKEIEINSIKNSCDEKQFMVDNLKWIVDQQKIEISLLGQKDSINQTILKVKENNLISLDNTLKIKESELKKQRKTVNTAIGFGIISAIVAFILSI